MSRKPTSQSAKTSTSREDRLKAALKSNLQRRKAQQAARGETDDKTNEKNKEAG